MLGVAALVVAIAIFRWTRGDDDERHGELLDALDNAETALAELAAGLAVAPADLSLLSEDERNELRRRLSPGEIVVKVARSSRGKGNHPWQAVTSHGRTLQVYTGGRTGGVHTRVLS